MTVDEVIENQDILKEEVQPEDALHFYCKKEDGNFTFVYQFNDKVYPFSAKLPKEQNTDLDNLKKQFTEFAEAIFNAINTGKGE